MTTPYNEDSAPCFEVAYNGRVGRWEVHRVSREIVFVGGTYEVATEAAEALRVYEQETTE